MQDGEACRVGTRQALRNSVLSSFFVLLEPGCAGILILALLAKHKLASSTLQGSDFGLSKKGSILTNTARTFGPEQLHVLWLSRTSCMLSFSCSGAIGEDIDAKYLY